MKRNDAQRRQRHIFRSRPVQKVKLHRPSFEWLEDRTMLATGGLPAAIVLGRTLATPTTAATPTPSPSYFVGEVENNQVTITYTVYNEQTDPETGVLLTTTLEPGVTFLSSVVTIDGTTTTQLPDQSGQNLAFSLGTIQGYDRESVAVTVALANPIPLQLDSGANAYAMVNAGAVSASTPAAALQPGNVSDPSLLASTVDADTNDPFIQEEAAALDYNARNIFSFLHTQIVYNSYLGSVRGARGTLWSLAGNALDAASLGVALMRASGIPAQYVSGTLSQSDAQELILSMFPAQYQTVGYIPAGTQVSDPANDPQLLSETESHYWFQFDTGSGMQDADPLMPGATIGQTFTTATGTFSAVPVDLEETTEVQVVAETYNEFYALLGGTGLSDQVVLDQTFDDDELLGRPLSIGNTVSTNEFSLGITQITYTYTPYLDIGDQAFPDPSNDETNTGTPYQEIYSNDDDGLDSQELTGLFLNVTLSGPQGPAETFQHTILDRIGFAARQDPYLLDINIPATNAPAFTDFDVTTVNVLAGLQDPNVIGPQAGELTTLQDQLSQLSSGGTVSDTAQSAPLLSEDAVASTVGVSLAVTAQSDVLTAEFSPLYNVVAYFQRPRLIVTSQQVMQDANASSSTVVSGIDLLNDAISSVVAPGQAASASFNFNVVRGFIENGVESSVGGQGGSNGSFVSTSLIFQQAQQQAIPLAILTSAADIPRLDSFGLDVNGTARIATALQAGQYVLVPTAPVTINGQLTTGWFQFDPNTGYTTGVLPDGGHQSLLDILGTSAIGQIITGAQVGFTLGLVNGVALMFLKQAYGVTVARNVKKFELAIISTTLAVIKQYQSALSFFTITFGGGFAVGTLAIGVGDGVDPSVQSELVDTTIPLPTPTNVSQNTAPGASALPAGATSGSAAVPIVAASGQLAAAWSTASTSAFQLTSVSTAGATVTDANGHTLGSGSVDLAGSTAVDSAVSGNNQYTITGAGSLSFYGPAESTLGVSGNWASYSATVAGNVTITLTTDGLTLNGQGLPAGTYTITTTSATLGGSGQSTAPNFSGSASLSMTSGTVTLGPENGSIALGGKPLDLSSGATLDGYTGTIAVAAGGANNTDTVTLSGSSANALTVSATPTTLTTDQNTPKTFHVNVNTSFADTYNLTAQAPPGWTVSIDDSGDVTVTPAPGLQSGTFPIQIIARSQTDLNLMAQTTVNVTVTPTSPGTTLTVITDPLLTVPVSGANIPTAFRVQIHNTGPAPVAENLAFSNVPSGFTLLDSGTGVTIPAGQTGFIGVYLQPDSAQLPAAGTAASYTVTATNAANPAEVQTFDESFTIPAVDAISLASSPDDVNTLPGVAGTATLTVTNVGNASETVTLAASTSAGLTVSGLQKLTVAAGQSATETISYTPSASTPYNSTLGATITATFGPADAPQTQSVAVSVDVVVPGATAIANAATAAGQLGDGDLAGQLGDLSTALTNLVENPTSAVYQSQAQASLTAVIGLAGSDPYLSTLVPALNSDAAALGQATTAAAVQTAVTNLGNDLDTMGTTLADEAASGFTLSLVPNSRVGQPQVPTPYQVVLQNTGTQTTTYDLSITGLPAGVSGVFSPSSITLQPGQSTFRNGGATSVNAMITSTSAIELPSFSFSIVATAEGAPEITQATAAEFAARTASVQIISVATDPPSTNPGGQVDVLAQILDAINQEQQAQVSFTVTDAGGNVVFTSQPVSTTLNVLTTLSTVDLGNLDTTNLADGDYTINVAVDDTSGNPIPGATGEGTLLVGTPVTAGLSTTPTTLPAGSGTVTSSLQIGGSGASGQTTVQVTVFGTDDAHLAGMPDGSTADAGDTAPAESPLQVVGIPIFAGSQLNFTASGLVNYYGGTPNGPPDGLAGDFFVDGAYNGISNVTAPIDCLLGVFLGPNQPDSSPAPPALDFSPTGNVPGGINYTSLAPELQQLFYIGSGVTASGVPQTITVPAGATRLFLATMDGYGWYNNTGSFQVGVTLATSSGVPVEAQATVPTNNGVSIDPNSFSIAPTSITTNSDNSETIEWDFNLPTDTSSQTITWQSNVAGLQPGQSLAVVQGATVDFISLGTPGSLTLPAQFVTGEEIIGISPPTQTVAPAVPAPYDVTLLNPTANSVTYDLSVQGVPQSWVSMESQVTVAPDGSVDVPLTLTSDSFAAPSDYGFTVTANGNDGAIAAVSGDLVLQGQPAPADPNSYGIVAALTPSQASAGQGTPAKYAVRLTNTGSTAETFSLAVSGLPSGVTATFGQSTIDVPPGASSFRDVTLTLTPDVGTQPGSLPFTVTATSMAVASDTTSVDGTLTVAAAGVSVSLNPGSLAPGGSFQAKVTNTGTVADTYNLALAGPAALVSSLGTSQVTLAPGASQMVTISAGAVDFAVQGSLPLIASATSTTNPAIKGAASANLSIPATQGMTAEFSPDSQTLAKPGVATFFLMVHNTGNAEDSYSATIMGTNGPVTATLVGLNGSPTQSVPTFFLPGLSTGAIELEASLASLGTGTVTVDVQSLTKSAISSSPVASVNVAAVISPAQMPTPSPTPSPSPTPTPATTVAVAPEMTGVERFGYHMKPTTLVLTFDQALDPSTAEDTHNYRIVGPHHGKVRVTSAVYDPAKLTVTLHTSPRINVHHRYTLFVNGNGPDGLANTKGVLMDGTGTGKPGSSDPIPITWRNLAGVSRGILIKYHFIKRDSRPVTHSARSKGHTTNTKTRLASDHAADSVSHRPRLFTRPPSFSAQRADRR
jgi:uncharacterized membrane protein/transglutaminase-like putative cysteine protease